MKRAEPNGLPITLGHFDKIDKVSAIQTVWSDHIASLPSLSVKHVANKDSKGVFVEFVPLASLAKGNPGKRYKKQMKKHSMAAVSNRILVGNQTVGSETDRTEVKRRPEEMGRSRGSLGKLLLVLQMQALETSVYIKDAVHYSQYKPRAKIKAGEIHHFVSHVCIKDISA